MCFTAVVKQYNVQHKIKLTIRGKENGCHLNDNLLINLK